MWLAYRKHDKNMNLRAKYAEVVVVVVVVEVCLIDEVEAEELYFLPESA